jgi:cytochrome c551/c552
MECYLRVSMLEPSAFVVAGFGKKGTNDSVSPMPNVAKPPLQLSDIEIGALIAFLQSKDGGEITVALPSADAAPMADEGGAEEVAMAATAEEALNKFGCTACHAIGDIEADVGPNLNTVGARLSAAAIRQSIINPNAVIAEGFDGDMMPDDFAEQMMVKELEMIVAFLASQKGE